MNNPESFKPEKANELIGVIRKVVAIQIAKVKTGRLRKLFLLLHGDPGCGKSSACRIISNEISSSLNITHVSACEVTADMVRDWMQDSYYVRMSDDCRVYWIEECDSISSTVETLMLQFIDKAPENTAILCTSNKDSKLTDRFQSRFQSIEVPRPKESEIRDFLQENWPALGESINDIAESCKGDVRAALNDAQAHLDFIEFGELVQ